MQIALKDQLPENGMKSSEAIRILYKLFCTIIYFSPYNSNLNRLKLLQISSKYSKNLDEKICQEAEIKNGKRRQKYAQSRVLDFRSGRILNQDSEV